MRYRILYINAGIILSFCKNDDDKFRVVKNRLPDDTNFIRFFTDDPTGWGRVGIIIESSEFLELKEGDSIPIHPEILFEKIS